MNEDRVQFDKKPHRLTQLEQGETYQCVAEPGNGTRYWIIVGIDAKHVPFVALPDFGVAARMEYRSYVHPTYVDKNLGFRLSAEDCEIVAEILNAWWDNN